MRNRLLSVIYCDDIRQEASGKLSFMGVFNGDMFLPSFPAALAKLCAYCTLQFHPDDAPKKSLKLTITFQDNVIGETELTEEMLKAAKIPPPDPEVPEDDRKLALMIGFEFIPFLVSSNGRLRSRAEMDGVEIKGNGLRISLATPDQLAAMGIKPQNRVEMSEVAKVRPDAQ